MNDGGAVVMTFFMVRVLVVGAIMYAFPRIARKGLMFGVYLGEERAESSRQELLRSWDTGSALIILVALTVGWSIGLTGRWVPGNLIGTVFLLVPFVPLYFWVYAKARRLAPPAAARQALTSAASLSVDENRGQGLALLSLGACFVVSLAFFGYAIVSFQTMPDRIPTLANLWGYGEELTDKSLVSVILIPAFSLVFSTSFAGMAMLVARSKRSVRGGSGGRSAEAQDTFRVAMSQLLAGTGLFTCLFLGVASFEMIRVWQGRAESLGAAVIGLVAVTMILFTGIGLVRIMRLGQGGARLETGSAEARLSGGLADNDRWILGVMYVDRADPAVMVEARWGFGYTMNLGNRLAQVLLATYLTALLGLTLLTLAAAGVF
jgi:uncharacterized membrane protein